MSKNSVLRLIKNGQSVGHTSDNEQCSSCENVAHPRRFDATSLDSPCYQCLFNGEMPKKNNFKPDKVTMGAMLIDINQFMPTTIIHRVSEPPIPTDGSNVVQLKPKTKYPTIH